MTWGSTIEIPLGPIKFHHQIRRMFNLRMGNTEVKLITHLYGILQNKELAITLWY